ncbi:MAG: TolC family protein [Candidatus Berkiellales bacterium]
MIKKRHLFVIIILSSVISPLLANTPRDITVQEILTLAEKNSYAINTAEYQELVAKKNIIIAKAGYFPIVNLEAIDSTGFPGSNNWLEITGLMGSPFRKELAGGVVAKQTIYDFGRTKYDVKKARAEVHYAEQNTKITAYEVKLLALLTYYDCAQYRRLEQIWQNLSHEAGIIKNEVDHFVNTGQRSVVDKYLSAVQFEEANTAQAYFTEKIKWAKHELAVITGLDEHSFTCVMLNECMHPLPQNTIYSSPFYTRAQADLNIAAVELRREKANRLPNIVTMASLGGLQEAHVVGRKNYSVGIGITQPLYDMRISGGIKRAQELLSAKNEEVEAQVQYLEEMNAKYDTIIHSSDVRLQHLSKELEIAQEGFKVAKHRYFDLEAQLVDVRDAFSALAKASVDTEESRANLLKGQGSKELLNGG